MQNSQEKKLVHYIKNTQDELKDYYNKLNGKYQGYIQLSDRRIEHIFVEESELPKWENLHNSVNYILEIAFFEPGTKKSILVRQANEKWLVLEKILTDKEIKEADSFYTVIDKENLQAKIAQIWEEEADEFCEVGEDEYKDKLKVLKPKVLMFAGFEESKGGKS